MHFDISSVFFSTNDLVDCRLDSSHLIIEKECLSKDGVYTEFRSEEGYEIFNETTLIRSLKQIDDFNKRELSFDEKCLLSCRQSKICSLAVVNFEEDRVNKTSEENNVNFCRLYNKDSFKYVRKVARNDNHTKIVLFQKKTMGFMNHILLIKSHYNSF